MIRKLLVSIGIALAAVTPALATPTPIHFTTSTMPASARPGELVTVTVEAKVDPRWHIYSVVAPVGGPSAADIKSAGAWTAVGPTREDNPITVFDSNFGLTVAYHEQHATYTRQFRVPDGQASATLPVTFHYQTCNDKICLPPTDVVEQVDVKVESGPARAEFSTASTAPATTAVLTNASARKPAEADTSGIGVFLLAAIAGGLLALLTPCVFPLVPITLTAFVKQADGDRRKLVRLSGGYALGIIGLYVAVGAIASVTLGAAGADRIAANPWVNLVEFVVFVLFALSFFETLTIRLPAKLEAVQGSIGRHGGNASIFAMGIAFVLASFTCTAPFVGTLLFSAANGNWFRPLLGMLVFATAFSSPFLFFAAFPQWITRLPRGGVWLARIKATLGFVELAAALKFLSNADQVWQWKILTQPVLLSLWAIICLCAGLYLAGILRFGIVAETEPKGAKPTPLRALFAAGFGVAAAICVFGLTGRSVGALEAFLPPAGYGGYGKTSHLLDWGSNYDTAIADAKTKSRLVLIDFTGYTCTNCRLNEKNVFPRPEIQKAMASFARVQLYTDGGPDGPRNQKLQQDKLGDVSLPLYAIIDPVSGSVVSQVAGVVSPKDFAQFLAKATTQAAAPAKAWSPLNEASLGHGRPTIVDFTAAWCVNCKAIEHNVFENDAVKPQLEGQFTTMRADMTDWDGAPSQALRKKYKIDSLPAILLFDANGNEIKTARITGQLSKEDFLKRLETVKPAG